MLENSGNSSLLLYRSSSVVRSTSTSEKLSMPEKEEGKLNVSHFFQFAQLWIIHCRRCESLPNSFFFSISFETSTCLHCEHCHPAGTSAHFNPSSTFDNYRLDFPEESSFSFSTTFWRPFENFLIPLILKPRNLQWKFNQVGSFPFFTVQKRPDTRSHVKLSQSQLNDR